MLAQIDLVSHLGKFVRTPNRTRIRSGWTESRALLGNSRWRGNGLVDEASAEGSGSIEHARYVTEWRPTLPRPKTPRATKEKIGESAEWDCRQTSYSQGDSWKPAKPGALGPGTRASIGCGSGNRQCNLGPIGPTTPHFQLPADPGAFAPSFEPPSGPSGLSLREQDRCLPIIPNPQPSLSRSIRDFHFDVKAFRARKSIDDGPTPIAYDSWIIGCSSNMLLSTIVLKPDVRFGAASSTTR